MDAAGPVLGCCARRGLRTRSDVRPGARGPQLHRGPQPLGGGCPRDRRRRRLVQQRQRHRQRPGPHRGPSHRSDGPARSGPARRTLRRPVPLAVGRRPPEPLGTPGADPRAARDSGEPDHRSRPGPPGPVHQPAPPDRRALGAVHGPLRPIHRGPRQRRHRPVRRPALAFGPRSRALARRCGHHALHQWQVEPHEPRRAGRLPRTSDAHAGPERALQANHRQLTHQRALWCGQIRKGFAKARSATADLTLARHPPFCPYPLHKQLALSTLIFASAILNS